MLKGALTLKNMNLNLRTSLLAFTACTMVGMVVTAGPARAQSSVTAAPAPSSIPGTGTETLNAIKIVNKKNLLKEKDLPSAITHLSQQSIDEVNATQGSIQTLLKLAPSVQAYSQGPGQSAPTLAIRGVKNDELAETLDGIPLTSFSGGSGDYLSNNIGAPVNLLEISSADVIPGVAPPEDQGFGTVGGTVAYTTKQPTNDPYGELEGGFGSFNTQHIGFDINTGKLYDSEDAPKAFLMYDQSETSGFVSNTPAKYHNFLFNIEKPYDNGLSKVGLVIIFNQGQGLVQTTPTPIALINANKFTYNFPESLGYYNQAGQFLTTILSNHSFINQYLSFDGSLFYQHSSDTIDSYAAPSTVDGSIPYAVNVQAPYNFFGDLGDPALGHQTPGYFTYNPTAVFGSAENGESSEYTTGHDNKIGATGRVNIFLPNNTIAIGGLIAKESSGGAQYVYGGDQAQENQDDGYNSLSLGGGAQRTVFVGYISDKIDLLDNKLHIEPGARVTAAYSSTITQYTDSYQDAKYQNFTKVGEPYIGISYDAPFNLVPYATYGKGSLFSPLADYAGGISGLPGTTHTPNPEIVHLYEAGLRYDTPDLLLSADYYYQNVTDAFSFFENYELGQFFYSNGGGYLLRGVEAQGKYRMTPTLTLQGNFSYNETDNTESDFAFVTLQNDQFGFANQGTPFSNTPKYLGNVALSYDSGPIDATVSGQYTGREYQTTDIIEAGCNPNTAAGLAICQEPLSGATITDLKETNAPDFLLNFVGSYKIPIQSHFLNSLSVTFTALNIIDLKYFEYKYGNRVRWRVLHQPAI
jgi:iron complex outermembrane receptor protein